ncbi:MAG TPA: bifunctional riboflavin kinase/FAD synthetase [Oscillospiraceae bacterium]|nr:bifunctional riboflavin kinase/FAD synthetase [Oscillospiraceae bacterium]
MKKSELKNIKASSIALGTFDGIHLGHSKVIENAVLCKDGEVPLILLFNEHPHKALYGKAPKRVITKNQQESLLKHMGITPVYEDFSSIMNLNSEDFVIEIARKYKVRQISCGFNFHFGKNAAGDAMTLKQICDDNGIRLKVSGAISYDGLPISSSRIRSSLEKGDVLSARNMLGRWFSYDFTIHESQKLGRKLGFPTINQYFPPDFIVPEYGVYASFTVVNEKLFPSVTNIGMRPTIGDGVMGSETHIIGIDDNLYGENILVSLTKKIRDEICFSSLEELKNQIESDKQKALSVWEEGNEKTN